MSTLALTGSIVGVYDTMTPFQQAVAGYFSKFHGATLRAYKQDLEQYFDWCAQQNLPPMAAKRFHVEMYLRWLIDHPAATASRPSRAASLLSTVSTRPLSMTSCSTVTRPVQ